MKSQTISRQAFLQQWHNIAIKINSVKKLPNGLHTNYKKEVQYHNGLLAQAEIITADMRLLQRFYNSLTGQLRP